MFNFGFASAEHGRRAVAVLATVLAVLLFPQPAAVDAAERQLFPNVHNVFGPYMDLIEELGVRRRVNVLYPNQQSLFDGLQVGFVHVGTGNLTFLRRDIVLRKRGPVILARVYDASIDANADLGPGWRLSLVEELHVAEAGTVTYVDGFGGHHVFDRRSAVYVPNPANPWHERTQVTPRAGSFVLTQADGTIRTFTPENKKATRYLMTSLKTAQGLAVSFSYAKGLLAEVAADGQTLFVLGRQGDGRLARVTDYHGRSVSYTYTAGGQLKDVYDLAGNLWWHQYDDRGLLTTAFGANREPYLLVKYDKTGRVIESKSGREYKYAYATNRTRVTEGTGERHTFVQDKSGITVEYSSASLKWKLTLDAEHRVQALTLPDRELTYTRSADGKIEIVSDSAALDEQKFQYDAEGRLISVTSRNVDRNVNIAYSNNSARITRKDGTFEFTISPAGLVTQLKSDGSNAHFSYDENDYLTQMQGDGGSVRFRRDQYGRVTATTYLNGRTNKYTYDRIGNRNHILYADGGTTSYVHDPAGNITMVDVREAKGNRRSQTVQIERMNRVDRIAYEGGGEIDITYDSMGRPTIFKTAEDVVSVKYATSGAIESLTSKLAEEVWVPGDDEQIRAPLNDPRLIALARDRVFAPHRDYGVLAFSDSSFNPVLHDLVIQGVDHLEDAHLLATVARSVLWPEHADPLGFEKPSNPIFQPDEYRSTNCCVPCQYPNGCGSCWTIGGTLSFGDCYCRGGTFVGVTVGCKPVDIFSDLTKCAFLGTNNRPNVPDGCTGVVDDPCRVIGDCKDLAEESTSFKPACDAHDYCYRGCGNIQFVCDTVFKTTMERICDNAYPKDCLDDASCASPAQYRREKANCKNHAHRYSGTVSIVGWLPFRKQQVRFCDCCQLVYQYTYQYGGGSD